MEINTTLLREKFTIRDTDNEGNAPIVATSNRLVLPLVVGKAEESEVFVIRAQNMHCCIRMAAQILQTFQRMGPLLVRAEPYDFQAAWDRICSNYEVECNLARWLCVYHKGKEIFSTSPHHPFLDVIEKCDSKNPGNYDLAVRMAEETFTKMGKKVSITYESNIGMVLNVSPGTGRCGLIHRGPEKNSTFNFVAEAKGDRVSPVMCMNVCAAFLEGIQLAFKIGTTNDKLRLMILDRGSTEVYHARLALVRMEELNAEVLTFENTFKVRFRPEKPEFHKIVTEAEKYHRRVYEARQRQKQ